MVTSKLTVVILTLNESIHIARAIKNVKDVADHIVVLDSYSDDNTIEIADTLGAEILYRKFDNYKNQRQFAIDYCKDKTEWMLFLDADEYLTRELKNEISLAINEDKYVGYYMAFRMIFMGKWIKYGGYYPTYILRLFKPRYAHVNREINEHVKVLGLTTVLKNDFINESLLDISGWIDKHNKYATFEAESLYNYKKKLQKSKGLSLRSQSDRKLWVRENIWNHLPLLFKPFLYFIYRYFFRLGFLDGKAGFIYHFLQGLWFWFLVDVKFLEIKNNLKATKSNENKS